MAHPKVEHEVIVMQLLELFRSVGYDGASLAQIAQATGLQKASLYHRFPEGKQEMANVVLEYIENWSQTYLISVLQSHKSPKDCLSEALANLDKLYGGGTKNCVLRTLSLGVESSRFQLKITQIYKAWMAGFEDLAINLGHPASRAERLSQDVLVRVQGALVLAQALDQASLFTQTLLAIEADFLMGTK